MKEYELYVPLSYNNGAPVESTKTERIGVRLLEQCGGVTYFPQPNQGLWRRGPVTFRDDIVSFRVLTDKVRTARRFFRTLKQELKEDLRQEEILIVETDADLL